MLANLATQARVQNLIKPSHCIHSLLCSSAPCFHSSSQSGYSLTHSLTHSLLLSSNCFYYIPMFSSIFFNSSDASELFAFHIKYAVLHLYATGIQAAQFNFLYFSCFRKFACKIFAVRGSVGLQLLFYTAIFSWVFKKASLLNHMSLKYLITCTFVALRPLQDLYLAFYQTKIDLFQQSPFLAQVFGVN